MTGWSGNDYIRFSQGVFGGGTNQTGNYWNYRLTFFTRGPGGSTTLSGTNTTSVQTINEIRGYGDTWWTAGNEYAANDKIYTHDYLKNVTFPAKVTASGGFSGNLTGNVTGNVTGTATGNLTSVQYDSTNAKLTYTKNGSNTDIVTVATLKSALGSMPASDVYSWAKASTKPSYTASEVGAIPSNHTYATSITTSSGTNQITLAYGTKYAITAGGTSYVFTMPSADDTNTWRKIQVNDTDILGTATNTNALNLKAGTGITLSNSNGAVTITNSSTNTDTKLQVAEVTSATQYYPIVGTGTTAATRQYDTTGFKYKGTNGTTSAVGSSILELGNSTGSGTANNKQAQLIMYGSNTKKATITLAAPSADIALALPTSGGTLALTSQIPTVSYPVTSVNSKTGAVSLTASDVGALASNTTYVSTVTTTAGTHTTISSKSGAVSFNVPTKTSHLTNDSGFLTSITHQTIKQDGVTGATGNHYGSCTTAAGTAAKTVSITAGTPTLEAGLRVVVKFSNANTANSPTLNVNSLGAKNIFHNGAQITSGTNKALLAGTIEFVYDGTQWQLVGNYVDTDTKAWGSITGKPTATGSNTTGITASTTATKTTLGTAFTIPNVTNAGSASTWAFEDIACDDITSWSAGSGSASISGAVDGSDSTQLNITISHTQTAPSLSYTARTVSSKKSGANGSAPTLGTAFTVPNVTGNTSATVSITDNGHTHSIS